LLRSQGLGDAKSDLAPHVYAVADRSYRQMMSEQRKSQAILISGESGAGKTESTKIVMLYLTTLGAGSKAQEKEGELSIMERVLQSNPVLEAFGNARTLRNDNSSRFGKFIELGFSRAGHLVGAKVQTYLLEKVRLAFHASGERNYHIFYQILRGATEEEKKAYRFHEGLTQGLDLPNYFHYTGQGGAPHLREFSDEDGLKYTLKAMKGLGWSEETIEKVLKICAGILHLGQITFDAVTNDDGVDAAVVEEERMLTDAAELMGVDVDKMKTALTERVIVARGQEIRTQLNVERAVDARDALAKTMYGALFLWVVDQVNSSICWKNESDVRSSTGVLDIFGFECFAVNSFEQLCINYTNEALQQQFNKFIFKMEQAEYEREKIEWAFISFPDNQDCLDTIQMKKVGILAMLDDECRLPGGNDKNWANRMYDHFLPATHQVESENTRFSATPVQKSKAIFCVRHFAGVVQYTAETGFMEKNRDEIPLTAQTLFETAPNQLVKDVYAVQKKASAEEVKAGKPAKSKTVGVQFKEQLTSLIENVEKTDPHYIRCLKPNDAAKPKLLTRKRLTEQLRYGGVLEAVRVARMGFPVRLNHEAFFQQYRMLLPTVPEEKLTWSVEGEDAQKLCVKLLDVILEEGAKHKAAVGEDGKLDPHEEGISRSEKIRRMQHQPIPLVFPKTDVQLGLTKVFMRKPPHDALEAHRVFHQHAAATIIQCWMRGMENRKRYLVIGHAAITAQRCYRGYKGRERYVLVVEKCTCVGMHTRGFSCYSLASTFVAGGRCERPWPVSFSRIRSECRSAAVVTIAPETELFSTRRCTEDTPHGRSWRQSRFRRMSESRSNFAFSSNSSLRLLHYSAPCERVWQSRFCSNSRRSRRMLES
jgi:myosin-5